MEGEGGHLVTHTGHVRWGRKAGAGGCRHRRLGNSAHSAPRPVSPPRPPRLPQPATEPGPGPVQDELHQAAGGWGQAELQAAARPRVPPQERALAAGRGGGGGQQAEGGPARAMVLRLR